MFDMQPSEIKEIKIDCMLIGDLNVGKHALINSQFPDSSDADSAPLMYIQQFIDSNNNHDV